MFLATTAIEDFWETENEFLFLGQWCVTDPKKLEGLRYKIFDCPYFDRSRKFEAHQYTHRVFEELLMPLTDWLNELHGKQHSVRYWKIIIGPFLLWYTQALYERYTTLLEATKQYKNLRTKTVSHESFFTPRNTLEFSGLVSSNDEWNLQLYTQIIEFLDLMPYQVQTLKFGEKNLNVNLKAGIGEGRKGLKDKLVFGLIDVLNRIFPVRPVMMYQFYMPFYSRVAIFFRSKFRIMQMLPMGRGKLIPYKVDLEKRASLSTLPAKDEFSKMLLATLKNNLPIQFVENYQALVSYSEKSNLALSAPKLIVSDSGWYYNEPFQVWAAACADKGTLLVGSQHGGGYGDRLYSSSEIYERNICDQYISWGWQEKNVVSLPSLVLQKTLHYSKKKEKLKAPNDKILFVATASARYAGSLESAPETSGFLLQYLPWQYRFFDTIECHVFDKMILRLYHHDYGWKIAERFRNRYPKLNIDNSSNSKNFLSKLVNAKIVVSDNVNTTFLQSLCIDKPTILFWDPQLWESRPHVKKFYNELKDANIFHDSPESASNFLNKNASSIDLWWQDPSTRKAYLDFVNNFARVDEKSHRIWGQALLSLSRTKKLNQA